MQTCSDEEFRCGSGQCIPLDWQCDGEQDCPEGLDEWDNLCSKFLICHITVNYASILSRQEQNRGEQM